jgi:hypothetical protein
VRPDCGNPRGGEAAVKVEVSDPTLVEDLLESLRWSGLLASQTGARTVDAHFGWPLREDAAGHELDAYLRVWEVRHRHAWAVRVGP